MSTRCNVVIKDAYTKLFFYRHSDGYPDGTMPSLRIFMDWLRNRNIRDNTGQAAGWLIVLGAMEYDSIPDYDLEGKLEGLTAAYGDKSTFQPPKGWKCGAYEPTNGIHGDIEYLYIIDLEEKTLTCHDEWTSSSGKHVIETY